MPPAMHPEAPKRRRGSDVAAAAVILTVLVLGGALWLRRHPLNQAPAPAPAGLPDDWLPTVRNPEPTPALKAVQARFDSAPDDATRHLALTAAGEQGEPAGVLWLARIAAQDPRVGRWAEDALARVKNRASALELGDVATSKGPPRVRAAAIRALGRAGELAQAAQLSAVIATPGEPMVVRQSAAVALGLIGLPGAVPALTTALSGAAGDGTHDGEELRVLIVQALARLGTPAAHDAIVAHGQRALAPRERAVVDSALATPPKP
ncbi:MAG TPA: HEAT repeat domain-containing protein [Polyangia bacterium]|nr:HEAT repeat domain-containing protein [Polyangia bacterium]